MALPNFSVTATERQCNFKQRELKQKRRCHKKRRRRPRWANVSAVMRTFPPVAVAIDLLWHVPPVHRILEESRDIFAVTMLIQFPPPEWFASRELLRLESWRHSSEHAPDCTDSSMHMAPKVVMSKSVRKLFIKYTAVWSYFVILEVLKSYQC